MSEQKLIVEYSLTRAEIVRTFVASIIRSSSYRRRIVAYSAAFGIFAILLRAMQKHSISTLDLAIGAAVSIGFFLVQVISVFVQGKTAKRTLTVSAAGLWTEIGDMAKPYEWNSIREIESPQGDVLISLASGNAFFIPSRAFQGPVEASRFAAQCNEWREAAKRTQSKA